MLSALIAPFKYMSPGTTSTEDEDTLSKSHHSVYSSQHTGCTATDDMIAYDILYSSQGEICLGQITLLLPHTVNTLYCRPDIKVIDLSVHFLVLKQKFVNIFQKCNMLLCPCN